MTHLGELFCKNCYVRLSLSTANHEIKKVQHSPAILTISAKESLNYQCYVTENSIGNASLNRNQHYQSDKHRLRGGGSEVEETSVYFDKEKKHFLGNECANLGVVNSMTTICDPSPSPNAITTWYNRQHSKFRRFKFILDTYIFPLFLVIPSFKQKCLINDALIKTVHCLWSRRGITISRKIVDLKRRNKKQINLSQRFCLVIMKSTLQRLN